MRPDGDGDVQERGAIEVGDGRASSSAAPATEAKAAAAAPLEGDVESAGADESARLITRAAGKMGIATSLSRVLGLARDAVFAAIFGTSAAADAFNLAFTIPNFFRRLLGEGILSAAFVPVYSEHMEKHSRDELHALGSAVLTDVALVLALLTAVGMVAARPLVLLYAPGWHDLPEQVSLTSGLTTLLFPYILFVGLAALVQAILSASYRFTVPALSPVVLNICFIIAAFTICPLFRPRLEDQIFGFAIGGLVGGLGQLLIQTPVLSSIGFRFRPHLDFRSKGVREVMALMGPGLFGLGVAQINVVVDTLFATFLPSGSVTALRLGSRVGLLPLGVFGVAIASASLPVLSRRVARGDVAAAREILSHSTRMILFVMLPASAGLMLFCRPITRLLFVRGAFDAGASLDTTASVILFLSIGLFAYGGVKGAVQVFYSLKDTRTPVNVAAISLLVNVALNALLMRPLGAGGLAFASSISSIVNMGLLLHLLRKRIGRLDGRAMAISTARIVAASCAMCVVAWAVYSVPGDRLPEERFVPLALRLALAIGAALVTYVGAASILRMDELAHLKSALGRRVKGQRASS